ncbi:MAG: RNA polymerase sigma factor [Vicinamibacterales bacterium]
MELVDHLFRREAGRMVATLTRALGSRHLQLAEEAVQDALLVALQQWPFRGVPDDPPAWLFRVAKNRSLDRLRRERTASLKAPAVAAGTHRLQPPPESLLAGEPAALEDDQLGLMFLTCDPTLPRDTAVALTLQVVGGFGPGEIARALLADRRAVQQRVVRAKRQLRETRAAFGVPGGPGLAVRLDAVLAVIYLMFNEGYAATAGDGLLREDVAAEALRLARLVTRETATAVPRAWALRALLALQASRFPARLGAAGELALLADQDRGRWDRGLIAEGLGALDHSATGGEVSAWHLEAGIAACHAAASSWAATDWPQIVALYDELAVLTASPVVLVNRAIARSQVDGPLAGIAAIEAIGDHPALARYHLRAAALGELWRQAGDQARAARWFREALALAGSAPERRFLAGRLEGL